MTSKYRDQGRIDYQLIACPQRADICQSKAVYEWKGTTTSEEININLISFLEKCSYLIKTTDGAPGFAITKNNFNAETWL
jgi:hypothetical protein